MNICAFSSILSNSVLLHIMILQLLWVHLPDVHDEIALTAALMLTEWTIKRLGARVFSHVLLEVLLLLESVRTMGPGASVGPQYDLLLRVKVVLQLGGEASLTVDTVPG